MMNINVMDHINLEVPNIAAAKDFYERVFGLQVKEEYEYSNKEGRRVKYLLIGLSEKLMLCLYENKEVDLKKMPLNHIGINVSNFDESYALAKELNIIDMRYDLIDYENSRSFYINDPNGLGIEISEAFGGGH